jgi:hypothetical protein
MKLSKRILFRSAAVATSAAVLSMAITAGAQAGLLENFENAPHTGGYVVDPGAVGQVTLTPDNTMSSEGSWSLRVETNGGFDFGAMRWDMGAVNAHHPQWLPPSTVLSFDVKVGQFTDFLTIRPSYIPSGPVSAGGTVNGPDFPLQGLNDGQFHTISWTYPAPGSGNEVPPVPTFWIEWFSTNSNGPATLWIDNIRTQVPEPASLAMLLVGCIATLGVRRPSR